MNCLMWLLLGAELTRLPTGTVRQEVQSMVRTATMNETTQSLQRDSYSVKYDVILRVVERAKECNIWLNDNSLKKPHHCRGKRDIHERWIWKAEGAIPKEIGRNCTDCNFSLGMLHRTHGEEAVR